MPTAQTSKDILADAAKTLKQNQSTEMALKDGLDQATDDIAAFGKAKAILASSVSSIKSTCDTLEDRLKELNKGLSDLQKNKAVMVAPADAKAYAKLVDEYEEAIQLAMEYDKNLTAATKKAQGMM